MLQCPVKSYFLSDSPQSDGGVTSECLDNICYIFYMCFGVVIVLTPLRGGLNEYAWNAQEYELRKREVVE